MKIFSISPDYSTRWNFSHELFRRELYEGHTVISCGPGHPISLSPNIAYVIKDYDPDVVFVHHPKHVNRFDLSNVKIPKVLFQIDYFPEREQWRTLYTDTQGFQVVVFPTTTQVNTYERCRFSKKQPVAYYLPFGVDATLFKNYHRERDLLCSGIFSINKQEYPQREEIINFLRKTPGTFSKGVYQAKEAIPKEEYILILNRSRSAIAPLDKYKSASLRVFEIPSCRTALVSNYSPDFDRLGFIDGYNYIRFDHHKEINQKIQNSDLEFIAAQGEALILKNHTNKHRSNTFWADLKKLL